MEGSSKGFRKGAWTAEEDCLLRQCVDKYGEGKWHQVPLRAGLNRCRKSCRLRWLNYLKPSIKKGKFSFDEVDLLLRLHKLLGNRWSLIAGRLPGRTANDVKNYWNTNLSKKHEPRCKNKIMKNIVFPSTIPTQKVDVFKPRPRSFSVNNGCSHFTGLPDAGEIPSCPGLNNNNVCENTITCDSDKEKDEFVYNLMNKDNMWFESLLAESEDGDTFPFDVEQLWNSFDGETIKLD